MVEPSRLQRQGMPTQFRLKEETTREGPGPGQKALAFTRRNQEGDHALPQEEIRGNGPDQGPGQTRGDQSKETSGLGQDLLTERKITDLWRKILFRRN